MTEKPKESAPTSAIADRTRVPPDELAQLLTETNFTDREIANFYKYPVIGKKQFMELCIENGIQSVPLMERMYAKFDTNHDGQLSHFELVRGLNALLRGTRDQVASLFFDLFDVNGDGELSTAELIAVYSDMVHYDNNDSRTGLSSAEKKQIRNFVENREGGGSGVLDKDAFLEEIRRVDIETKEPKKRCALLTWRTIYYVFLVSWFEMGTSFSLPAMGALSDRIKYRFDVGDQEIGTLTSAYFFSAMVGPLIGGIFMDNYGPGKVIIAANVVVLIGAAFQAIADGKDQFALLLVGRLLLGLGGEITPFTTVEILGRLFPEHLGLMVRNFSWSFVSVDRLALY